MTEKMIARSMARCKVTEILAQKGCKYPESRKCRKCGHCLERTGR